MGHIKSLERRLSWLANRIQNATGNVSFDKREKRALEAAIAALKHHDTAHPNCKSGGRK
ncbi:MAG TPA: hypothetical protein VFK94_06600 [Patescibacteria group bacterium]|nr:hypothetical protein [Patescibacteria group bacterium]